MRSTRPAPISYGPPPWANARASQARTSRALCASARRRTCRSDFDLLRLRDAVPAVRTGHRPRQAGSLNTTRPFGPRRSAVSHRVHLLHARRILLSWPDDLRMDGIDGCLSGRLSGEPRKGPVDGMQASSLASGRDHLGRVAAIWLGPQVSRQHRTSRTTPTFEGLRHQNERSQLAPYNLALPTGVCLLNPLWFPA
jgi:hypothetical protein